MAKRKVRKKKNTQRGKSFWVEIKRFIAIVCVLIVAIIGLSFLYLHYVPEEKAQKVVDGIVQKVPEIIESKAPNKLKTENLPTGAEIPVLKNGAKQQIIKHEGYTVSYNSDFKIPNWVAYELTREKVSNNKVKRHNKFIPDPEVKGATALNEDYTRTGYDRGHMVPAGDMKWSEKVMRETFYFSNICPQDRGLNSGVWNDLEMTIRVWAKEHKRIYIACGPVIEKDLKRLGKNRVGIPRMFYKVVCDPEKAQSIGFLFENRDYKQTSPRDLAVTVDRVEEVTGIDFFSQFPNEIEKEMEAKVDLKFWSFFR
ncbi:DNA/RNA non-specific endonuclease [Massilibacteroides vaginae]|uniref:DNA/RNA non-specific endonuclease n=1 Tax=Massilibacteroides vaginae TaxID=1673718 RepID=UPI000A1CF0BF|nr:DNA/RNA non-specific endonuclease [Massilibacteroides vaginae]